MRVPYLDTESFDEPTRKEVAFMNKMVLTFTLITVVSGYAPGNNPASSPQNPPSRPVRTQSPDTSIRKVDFRNFTYRLTSCHEVEGIGPTVQVRKAKFGTAIKKDGALLKIHPPKYGDLTNDAREEAVVPIVCEPEPNNDLYTHEIHVYTMR